MRRKLNTVAYNLAMKSRRERAGKRLYTTARDVLADPLPSAIAQRLKIQPLPKVSDANRLRANAPASARRKSASAQAPELQAALARCLSG
jgi:hypothetical protein